ncbi:MAG: protein phosphatase 2C domain-containing protein, partial [Chlamydiales bacterium]|nr:protein phosphatase 2C domain-containing protein [Chlamydiales bacterium]
MVREVNSGDANWEIRAYTGKLSSSENSLGDELNKGILFSVKNQETGEVRVHKIKVRTRKDLEKPANEVDDVANKVAEIAEEFISEAIGALGVSGLTNLGSDVQGLILNFKEQDDGSLRLSREIGLQYQKSDGSLEKGEASKAKKLEVPSFTSAAAKTYRAALDMGLAEQSKLVALVGSLKIADFPRGSDVGQLLKQKIIDAGIESIGDRDPIDFLTTHEDLSGHQEELSNFLTNLFDEHYPSLSENQYKGKASALTKDFPLAKADLLCSLAKRLTGEQLKSRKSDLLTYAAGISLHKEVSPDLAEEADTLLAKLKGAISRTLEDGEKIDSLISSKLGSVKDVLRMNIDADDEDEEGDKVDEGPDLELRFKVEGEDDHGDEESIDVEVGALRKMGIAPQLADQIVPDAELLKGVKSLSSNLQTTAKDTLTKLLVGASSYAEKEKILLAASMVMHHKLNSLSGENPAEVSKCVELATLIKDQYVQLESKEPINKDSSFIVSALLMARYETSPLEEEVKEALQSLTDFTSVGQLPSEEQDEYIYIISQAYLNSLKDNETSLEKNKIVFQGLMPDLSKDGGPKEWRVKSARQMDRAFQDFLGDMSLLVSGKEHKQINPEIHQKLPLNEVLIKKFISEAREWRTLDDETAAEGKTAAERIAKHTKELQYRLEDDSPYSCLGSKVDSIDSELSGVYDGERAVLNSDSPLGFTIEERSSALGAEELDGDVVAEGYQASVCHWQGFRPNQEDAHILNEIEVEIADKSLKIPVFGVLDGHGGAACSQYVRENLPRILKEKLEQFSKGKFPLSEEAIYNALKIAFVELDAEYKGRDGTTAVVSIVIGDKLYTANAGDSRAVLSREEGEDSYHIYELSKDQDSAFSEGSYESFEESSVVKRGGTFSSGRIGGNLKLGRAIGDPGVHVSARPKISCRTIQPGDTLTFACDGLWDSTAAPSEDPTKFSSREIGAFAASIDPTKAAKKLTQLGVKLERERF